MYSVNKQMNFSKSLVRKSAVQIVNTDGSHKIINNGIYDQTQNVMGIYFDNTMKRKTIKTRILWHNFIKFGIFLDYFVIT